MTVAERKAMQKTQKLQEKKDKVERKILEKNQKEQEKANKQKVDNITIFIIAIVLPYTFHALVCYYYMSIIQVQVFACSHLKRLHIVAKVMLMYD